MLITKRQLLAIQRLYGLSPREIQIVKLLFDGIESNKDLAEKLDISVAAVKLYLHNLYNKLGMNSKFQVIVQLSKKAQKLSE